MCKEVKVYDPSMTIMEFDHTPDTFFSPHLRTFFPLLLERERKWERNINVREKHWLVASLMCPDWGSNLQPFSSPDDALSNRDTPAQIHFNHKFSHCTLDCQMISTNTTILILKFKSVLSCHTVFTCTFLEFHWWSLALHLLVCIWFYSFFKFLFKKYFELLIENPFSFLPC